MKMSRRTTVRTPLVVREPYEDRTSLSLADRVIVSSMSWDAKDIVRLKKLWAVGQSAAQIARRLGCSRSAVCGKLNRLGLKRGRKPPTAKPKIRPIPKPRQAVLATCTRPVAKKVSRKTAGWEPTEYSKRQLYAMLAEAVRNTG
jgi:GcrA cell cycle regulator